MCFHLESPYRNDGQAENHIVEDHVRYRIAPEEGQRVDAMARLRWIPGLVNGCALKDHREEVPDIPDCRECSYGKDSDSEPFQPTKNSLVGYQYR